MADTPQRPTEQTPGAEPAATPDAAATAAPAATATTGAPVTPTATLTPGGLNVEIWSPGDDVIAVQRAPEPGAGRSFMRAFVETLRGMVTTLGRLKDGPITIQYPEEKVPVYPRFRGRHKLHRFEDSGLEKCVGCSLCAAACPADCIRVVSAENTPESRISAGERYAAVYEINMSRCIFCGYCEVACPFDAITMGHDYELSDLNRSDLIFTKEMLLAEPLERTPLRREGE
jgi:NADH-quinone oxidoreductase subunit I